MASCPCNSDGEHVKQRDSLAAIARQFEGHWFVENALEISVIDRVAMIQELEKHVDRSPDLMALILDLLDSTTHADWDRFFSYALEARRAIWARAERSDYQMNGPRRASRLIRNEIWRKANRDKIAAWRLKNRDRINARKRELAAQKRGTTG